MYVLFYTQGVWRSDDRGANWNRVDVAPSLDGTYVAIAASSTDPNVVIVAPDASPNSRKKLLPLLTAKRILVREGLGAETLGAAAGRSSTAAIGITDASLAKGVRKLFDEG